MSQKSTEKAELFICHKCGKPVSDITGREYVNHPNDVPFPPTWFHDTCFNRYEHYYGLDKPVD